MASIYALSNERVPIKWYIHSTACKSTLPKLGKVHFILERKKEMLQVFESYQFSHTIHKSHLSVTQLGVICLYNSKDKKT